MKGRRISESLMLEHGSVCCRGCSHLLGPAGRGWKKAAVLRTVKIKDLPGVGSGVDAETALSDDPFLEDVVFP